jgi:hypothetical protein
VHGVGTAVDGRHLHVLRVLIVRSFLDRMLKALIAQLPKRLRHWIASSVVPGLFLPDRVVLKQCKDDWEAFFGQEKVNYDRLQHLQGGVIPILYGETKLDGMPALILSEIVGVMPWEQTAPLLSVCELRQRVSVALQEFNDLGLAYNAVHLGHIILVDDGVVLIDMWQVQDVAPEDREGVFEADRAQVEDAYSRFIECRYAHERDRRVELHLSSGPRRIWGMLATSKSPGCLTDIQDGHDSRLPQRQVAMPTTKGAYENPMMWFQIASLIATYLPKILFRLLLRRSPGSSQTNGTLSPVARMDDFHCGHGSDHLSKRRSRGGPYPYPATLDGKTLDLVLEGGDRARQVAAFVRVDRGGDDGAAHTAGASEGHLRGDVDVRHVLVPADAIRKRHHM